MKDAEIFGPPALRHIGPAEVDPIAFDFSRRLRALLGSEGRRSATIHSMASALAAAIILDELGGPELVLQVVGTHVATAHQRIADREAGAVRQVVQ